MERSLTIVLRKVFVNGFYKAHAGMFLFAFLVIFGSVDPGQLVSYHQALMLAFLSDPYLLLLVFAAWLLYAAKILHYVAGQLAAPNQQFLFYSTNSFSRTEQGRSWFIVALLVLQPVLWYGIIAAGMGIYYGFYVASVAIAGFLLLLTSSSAFIFYRIVGRLSDGNSTSFLLRLSAGWQKPFFSLYLYQVLNSMKVMYLVTKLLSWLIIVAVFNLFADVRQDARVACIAILAIATAHAVLVFNQHTFEQTRLVFARNLPYRRWRLFTGYALGYLLLILPEAIWLFGRFSPVMAAGLLLFALSNILLLHSLLYWLGPNMDKYLQWVGGLFVVLFWVVMFKLAIPLVFISLGLAYGLFYVNYYQSHTLPEAKMVE